MLYKLKSSISSQFLAAQLNLYTNNIDLQIDAVAALSNSKNNCLTFSHSTSNIELCSENFSVICDKGVSSLEKSLLFSRNPRLAFVKALAFITEKIGFRDAYLRSFIHPTVKTESSAIIESGVVIGAGSIIGPNVVIRKGTKIGENCIVQPGAILGEEGFGFEKDIDNSYIKMHHLGGLQIGNDVQIGANSTVCRGTLSDTVIGNGVKIDNLVHIGHNCQMGNNVIVTACVELGGIKIGDNVWIGPNSCIREKLYIEENAFIGLGSVVVKNVERNTIVAGNPAKFMRYRK
jgi:UDP-3-O-[3-hydroxymyristoyl] glucosamine N-acyltransferase